MRFLVVFLALICAAPNISLAKSTQDVIAQNTIDGWHEWMAKHNIKGGAISISYNGEEIASDGINRGPDDPAPVASLSKAITGFCTIKAFEAAGTSLDITLGELLPDLLAKNAPKDPRFADIAVKHLLAQTSGIDSRYHTKLEVLRTFAKENKPWQLSKFSAETLTGDPGKAPYTYANANFLALGLAIEAVSGADYETYCKEVLLAPIGITTAKLADDWTVMSSWGGWEISSRDYMKFADAYLADNKIFGQDPRVAVPSSSAGNQRRYASGVFLRPTAPLKFNYWHIGSWRWKGRINSSFGAYFAKYGNGYTVSTNYDFHAFEGQANELDGILWTKTHQQ
jgi:CubicO group peptidase (beta-lactamase class C family)